MYLLKEENFYVMIWFLISFRLRNSGQACSKSSAAQIRVDRRPVHGSQGRSWLQRGIQALKSPFSVILFLNTIWECAADTKV